MSFSMAKILKYCLWVTTLATSVFAEQYTIESDGVYYTYKKENNSVCVDGECVSPKDVLFDGGAFNLNFYPPKTLAMYTNDSRGILFQLVYDLYGVDETTTFYSKAMTTPFGYPLNGCETNDYGHFKKTEGTHSESTKLMESTIDFRVVGEPLKIVDVSALLKEWYEAARDAGFKKVRLALSDYRADNQTHPNVETAETNYCKRNILYNNYFDIEFPFVISAEFGVNDTATTLGLQNFITGDSITLHVDFAGNPNDVILERRSHTIGGGWSSWSAYRQMTAMQNDVKIIVDDFVGSDSAQLRLSLKYGTNDIRYINYDKRPVLYRIAVPNNVLLTYGDVAFGTSRTLNGMPAAVVLPDVNKQISALAIVPPGMKLDCWKSISTGNCLSNNATYYLSRFSSSLKDISIDRTPYFTKVNNNYNAYLYVHKFTHGETTTTYDSSTTNLPGLLEYNEGDNAPYLHLGGGNYGDTVAAGCGTASNTSCKVRLYVQSDEGAWSLSKTVTIKPDAIISASVAAPRPGRVNRYKAWLVRSKTKDSLDIGEIVLLKNARISLMGQHLLNRYGNSNMVEGFVGGARIEDSQGVQYLVTKKYQQVYVPHGSTVKALPMLVDTSSCRFDSVLVCDESNKCNYEKSTDTLFSIAANATRRLDFYYTDVPRSYELIYQVKFLDTNGVTSLLPYNASNWYYPTGVTPKAPVKEENGRRYVYEWDNPLVPVVVNKTYKATEAIEVAREVNITLPSDLEGIAASTSVGTPSPCVNAIFKHIVDDSFVPNVEYTEDDLVDFVFQGGHTYWATLDVSVDTENSSCAQDLYVLAAKYGLETPVFFNGNPAYAVMLGARPAELKVHFATTSVVTFLDHEGNLIEEQRIPGGTVPTDPVIIPDNSMYRYVNHWDNEIVAAIGNPTYRIASIDTLVQYLDVGVLDGAEDMGVSSLMITTPSPCVSATVVHIKDLFASTDYDDFTNFAFLHARNYQVTLRVSVDDDNAACTDDIYARTSRSGLPFPVYVNGAFAEDAIVNGVANNVTVNVGVGYQVTFLDADNSVINEQHVQPGSMPVEPVFGATDTVYHYVPHWNRIIVAANGTAPYRLVSVDTLLNDPTIRVVVDGVFADAGFSDVTLAAPSPCVAVSVRAVRDNATYTSYFDDIPPYADLADLEFTLSTEYRFVLKMTLRTDKSCTRDVYAQTAVDLGSVPVQVNGKDAGNLTSENNFSSQNIAVNLIAVPSVKLDWTRASDVLHLSDYDMDDNTVVRVAPGKQLYSQGKIYSGTLNSSDITAIGTGALYPVSGLALNGSAATLDGGSSSVIIPTEIPVSSVSFNREFSAKVFATAIFPFSVKVGDVSGAAFYRFRGVSRNATTGVWEADMLPLAAGDMIAANTPYLLNPAADGQLAFANVSSLVPNTESTYGFASDGWNFIGTYGFRDWQDDDAGLGLTYGFAASPAPGVKAGQFVRVEAGASIAPMRAYLERIQAPARASARPAPANSVDGTLPERIVVRILDGDGSTTVIGTLDTRTGSIGRFANGKWYSVDGRLLGTTKPSAKGVYYHDGQRVIIK